ncbi:MAG: hypothetical protein ACREKS_12265 [Candidatus Rokuibacteriota bacterium]
MRVIVLWVGLLVVGAAAVLGPVAALADESGRHKPKPPTDSDAAIVYEVAEWGMFVPSKEPFRRRQATATLVGEIEAGVTICPKTLPNGKPCKLVILASDDISLKTGHGPVEGDFWVVTQLDNDVDGPEGIILAGKLFDATIDLSPVFQGVPLGSLSGRWEAKGTKGGLLEGYRASGDVTGVFRLPFAIMEVPGAFYLVKPGDPFPGCCQAVKPIEESLGVPTVRLELSLTLGK